MKYTALHTNRYKKDVKLLKKRGAKLELLTIAINKLLAGETLGEEYNLHPLEPKNQTPKRWDIHIGGKNSDWVLIFYYSNENKAIIFERTGTHSDLF
jgi:mRNA interferase YafQ